MHRPPVSRRGVAVREEPPMTASSGLTTVELLVCLVLALVLAALLSAGLSKARKVGAAAGDVANMRQMGIAIESFCQDHRNQGRIFFAYDRYTGGQNRYGYGPMTWTRLLRPYFGEERTTTTTSVKAFISPGDPTHGIEIPFYAQRQAAWGRRSYSFNIQSLDPAPGADLALTNSRKRTDIPYPSRFMLFCNHRATLLDTNWVNPVNPVFTDAIPDNWFAAKSAHFAFLDGHIESIPVKEVLPGGSRHSIFFP